MRGHSSLYSMPPLHHPRVICKSEVIVTENRSQSVVIAEAILRDAHTQWNNCRKMTHRM